jgi:hypothetical protein
MTAYSRATVITPDSLMSWPAYAQYRLVHRTRAIAHRLARTVGLGPHMRLQFEDEATVRYQIQEMLHAEHITGPVAIQHEIDSVSHLLPDGTTWCATLMIQIPFAQTREQLLPMLSLAAHQIFIDANLSPRVFATTNDDLADRHLSRPSAVHFLRFSVPDSLRQFRLVRPLVTLGCASEAYAWQRDIPPVTFNLLEHDLTECWPDASSQFDAATLCAAD